MEERPPVILRTRNHEAANYMSKHQGFLGAILIACSIKLALSLPNEARR